MARRRVVEPAGRQKLAPRELANGCVVEDWVSVADWSPNPTQVADIASGLDPAWAVLLEARRLHAQALQDWKSEFPDAAPPPYGRPRWANLEAARPLLDRWSAPKVSARTHQRSD